jgi:hypothetical protein
VRVGHPARASIRALLAKYARTAGGHFQLARASGTSALPHAAWIVRQAWKQCVAFWTLDATYSTMQRVTVTSVELLILGTKLWEVARLACGGRPRRC